MMEAISSFPICGRAILLLPTLHAFPASGGLLCRASIMLRLFSLPFGVRFRLLLIPLVYSLRSFWALS